MDACSRENDYLQEGVIFENLSPLPLPTSGGDDDETCAPMAGTNRRDADAFSDNSSNKRHSGRTTAEHSADVYSDDDDDRCSGSDKDEDELLSPLSCNNNDDDGVSFNNNDSDSMNLEYDSFLEYSSAIDNNGIVQDDVRDKRRKSMGALLGMGSRKRNDPMLDLRVLAQLTMMKNIIRVVADELLVEPRGLLMDFEVGSLSPIIMNRIISQLKGAIQKNTADRPSLSALPGSETAVAPNSKEVRTYWTPVSSMLTFSSALLIND